MEIIDYPSLVIRELIFCIFRKIKLRELSLTDHGANNDDRINQITTINVSVSLRVSKMDSSFSIAYYQLYELDNYCQKPLSIDVL